MIRHPYGPDELDRRDPALDGIAEQLQAFASDLRSGPSVGLAARIHAAVDAAPDPTVGWWQRFSGPMTPWATPARGLAAAAVVAAAVVAALVVGDIADLVRGPIAPGATLSPSVIVSPTPSPSPSPSPSLSPSPSPSESPRPASPAPSASDEDEFETPEPSESDNSGPGGGGGDNSGSGGGDNSGPGGGGVAVSRR